MSEKKVILILGQRGSGKSYLARHLIQEIKRLIIYDTLGEYDTGINVENLNEFKEFFLKTYQGDFKICYQPVKPQDDFEAVCDIAYECGDLTFLVEEIDTFCSAQDISENFANIIQRGRHKNITLIGVSQRPFGIPRLVTSQAKVIYSFIHREPRDLDYLKAYIGDEAEKIKDLKPYEFLKWDNGAITVSKL
jgi:ABC-type phosphate/phosphonate transport system ATPase subunit